MALLPLPSGLWRIGVALGYPMGIRSAGGVGIAPVLPSDWAAAAPLLALTAVSEVVGLLALGLVRPWGEVFPRRIPWLGGRGVLPGPVTAVATAGAISLTAIWTFATVNFLRHNVLDGSGRGFVFANGWWEAVMVACYLPLLAWGPLLLALTWAYYRRRR